MRGEAYKPDVKLLLETFNLNPDTGDISWKSARANGKVKAGSNACMKAAKNYLCVYIQGKKYKAHHVVWAMVKGYWPTVLDHIDGNRSNNSIHNLREVGVDENSWNRGVNKNNSLGIRGVHALPSGRFRATINYKGKRHHLGVFDSEIEAKDAYDKSSLELRKEFHREC